MSQSRSDSQDGNSQTGEGQKGDSQGIQSKERQRDSQEGRLIVALSHDSRLRVLAVFADQAAQEIVQRHGLKDRAAQLGAEGVVASLLLSAHIKDKEHLMVQVQSVRPRFTFAADVHPDGSFRARMSPNWLPATRGLKGTLMATKWLGRKTLYRGAAELTQSWEVSLQAYLSDSQQTLGLVRVLVVIEQGKVVFAAGLLVESVGGSELSVDDFEALVGGLRQADLREVMTGFAFGQLQGSPVQVLESRRVGVNCSDTMARVESMLLALGATELRSILEELGQAEVTCDWCNDTVVVGAERLRELIDELS